MKKGMINALLIAIAIAGSVTTAQALFNNWGRGYDRDYRDRDYRGRRSSDYRYRRGYREPRPGLIGGILGTAGNTVDAAGNVAGDIVRAPLGRDYYRNRSYRRSRDEGDRDYRDRYADWNRRYSRYNK